MPLLLQSRAATGRLGDAVGEQRCLLGLLAGSALQLGQPGYKGICARRKLLCTGLQGGQAVGGIRQCRAARGSLACTPSV